MSRPPPFHATLTKLAAESRELRAREVLVPEAIKQTCAKAACQGLNSVIIPVGPASLARTAAAEALRRAMPGLSFEWVESLNRDGVAGWELRILWPFVSEGVREPADAP